jgi:Fe-S-cluster containining protein
MDVDCEGCAGCCIDWRPLVPDRDLDHERRGRYRPLDDTYNLAILAREDVRALLDAGLADAMAPRLFHAEDGIEVDGESLAAVGGDPVFLMGLRKPPKPVGPFGQPPEWLPTCAFLDPETLQCRIHDTDLYPGDCAAYPGYNLALGRETECERVEDAFGGERLLDGDPEHEGGLLLGPQALGEKVFTYPDDLSGTVAALREGALDRETRADFVAVAAASAPGTAQTDSDRRAQARERALDADGWVREAIAEWDDRAGDGPPESSLGAAIEEERGAPSTPGWD